MKTVLFFIALFIGFTAVSQKAVIKGDIKTKEKEPIEGVAITYLNVGTTSDKNGAYTLNIPADVPIEVKFSHIGFKTIFKKVIIPSNKTLRYSPILEASVEEIEEIEVRDSAKEAQGIISVTPKTATKIPGANAGVENLLMTLPGVNNNNELSTQYNVRGGNFDENLVYVNGIEVYRPFLVRSGQQEGLSFINTQMVQNIKFSAGGFQAKYGDKLSSVLDITYKTPEKFEVAIQTSLLGGSATIEGKLMNDKLSALVGIRYRDHSLFIDSQDIETNSNPKFADIQSFLSYEVNPKLKIDFLGNFALNNYHYIPKSRRTNFGTLTNPIGLIVFYEGQEKDEFKTLFGALKGTYILSENLNVNFISSLYHTTEQEYFDILANYNLGEVNTDFGSDNFGEIENYTGIGSQLNHARNNLDALIGNIAINAAFKKELHLVEFGIKHQFEDIRDRLKEWEVIDSLGFNVRPLSNNPNNEPYQPFTGELLPFRSVDATNNIRINRFETFVQYSKISTWGNHKIWYNAGLRAHHWNVTAKNQTTFSLRTQFAIKPDWKKDMLFRLAIGTYNQPPFYKELRNYSGIVNENVEAQHATHFIVGNDYSFNLWNRPFKLTSEMYFKNLTNVNTYTVDNVKIRYAATNNAKGYATGLDLRLNGEFVPGTESWVSIGFLKTEENSNSQGYISRPTDQLFKFAMLFQDYVPTIPNIKMYLNLVFNTGVPGGSPSYANPYVYQNRLNAYKRADIGVSYVFVDTTNSYSSGWKSNFKELAVGFEIFNMFDVQNAITNTWVRDSYSKQFYGIPNYMTSRVFNVKVDVKF
ncbi:TonB-dependent receptor [Lutibacter sp.]|uniref:TonB-dependent receptor n=1 Tax=Lutibacter sp. TaxID=1925666 RepID=UPI0027323161|nr:TonB-dependent receptor [Lutibacter sp.]MDP3311881.1 TonB-dependent receptor [Lutibacter sp.]